MIAGAFRQPATEHWTINQFRRRHQEALAGLFRQTVVMAMKAGLVDLRHVAVDGTKLKANASKHSAMSYSGIEKEEKSGSLPRSTPGSRSPMPSTRLRTRRWETGGVTRRRLNSVSRPCGFRQ